MIRFAKKHDDDLKQNTKGDYLITDKEGKKHLIKADIANKWLESFNLKSLDDEFVPDFSDEIKELLANQGIDTNAFKINISDLVKLQIKGRTKYIKEIQPTFYQPNFVFKDEQGDIIFAKEISNRLYFANITRLYNDDFLSVSLSPKKENTIKNKLEKAKKIYYKSSELRDSSAHKASTGFLSSTSKDLNKIIPQIDKKVNMRQNTNYLNNYIDSALDSIKAEELAKSKNKIAKKDIQTIQKHKKQR